MNFLTCAQVRHTAEIKAAGLAVSTAYVKVADRKAGGDMME